MKKVNLAFLTTISLFFATAAQADINYEFSGIWQGSGKIQEAEMINAVDAHFSLEIKKSDSSLALYECWTVADAIQGHKESCYQTEFSVNEAEQILSDGNHVGDIFPRYILIFRGNSQVSEQMKFGIDTSGALIFHYTYANYDGGMTVRSARLIRK